MALKRWDQSIDNLKKNPPIDPCTGRPTPPERIRIDYSSRKELVKKIEELKKKIRKLEKNGVRCEINHNEIRIREGSF